MGRFKSAECDSLVERYLKLAGKFAAIERAELTPVRGLPETRAAEAQDLALERFLDKRSPRSHLTILDEKGRSFTSRALAAQVEKLKDASLPEWLLAVGGAHGYGARLSARAKLLWSLSPLTLPHELAATVAAEQVFRALSILHKHPYHND